MIEECGPLSDIPDARAERSHQLRALPRIGSFHKSLYCGPRQVDLKSPSLTEAAIDEESSSSEDESAGVAMRQSPWLARSTRSFDLLATARSTRSLYALTSHVEDSDSVIVGQGAHSVVYKCRRGDKSFVAVKRSGKKMQNAAANLKILDEFQRSQCLHHENLVVHIALVHGGSLVMEYVDGGSLEDAIARNIPFCNEQVTRIVSHVFAGLAHLHAHRIIHRDVKPSNILISSTGTYKLCDWISQDEAYYLHSHARSPVCPVGTPVFLAPEVVRTGRHCFRSDVWSVGCTVLNLLTGKLPWEDEDNVFAAMFKTAQGLAPPYDHSDISEPLRHLLSLCFQPDASFRPDPAALLELPLCHQHSEAVDQIL